MLLTLITLFFQMYICRKVCVDIYPRRKNISFIQACAENSCYGLARGCENNKYELLRVMAKNNIKAVGLADNMVLYLDGTLCKYDPRDPCIYHPKHVMCITKYQPKPCDKKCKKENVCDESCDCDESTKTCEEEDDCELCKFIIKWFSLIVKICGEKKCNKICTGCE